MPTSSGPPAGVCIRHGHYSTQPTVIRTLVVALLAGLASACSPARLLNALVPDGGYAASEDLAYGEDPRQKADVFAPRPREGAAAPAGGYPVVVFFYGGSWNKGERKDYRFVAEALTSRGMVVILADYRLYPQVRYPEFLADCARAVAWARKNAAAYGGNPEKLFLMGHSAGAYNAAMLALDPRWLAAQAMAPSQLSGWIGLAGPYDFFPAENPDVRPVFFHPNYPQAAQPIEHAVAGSPRAFLAAPATDSVVNPDRNTRRLAAALGAAGVPVTLKIYEHVHHVTLAAALARPLRGLAPVLDDVSAFVAAPGGRPAISP